MTEDEKAKQLVDDVLSNPDRINWGEVIGVVIKAVIAWCVFRLLDRLCKKLA